MCIACEWNCRDWQGAGSESGAPIDQLGVRFEITSPTERFMVNIFGCSTHIGELELNLIVVVSSLLG